MLYYTINVVTMMIQSFSEEYIPLFSVEAVSDKNEIFYCPFFLGNFL